MAKRRTSKKIESASTAGGEKISVAVECPVYDSYRVAQVAGMFDVPPAERAKETFDVELPLDSEPWQIGVVVGPSGSGKSTVSNHRWPANIYRGGDWPHDRAVIDCFGRQASLKNDAEFSVKEISAMLTSVGFSSPPSWIKPYSVLSNGEKFRCDLARALLAADGESPLVVFDEFTSVVDRTVAKIGSAAVSKAVRRRAGMKFVAVTCHYDVVEWLEPDWVLDMNTRTLTRRLLRRPRIELEIHEAGKSAWELFKKTHYMSAAIPAGCKCFVATWKGEPVGCVIVAVAFGKRRRGYIGSKRISRVVVLPDFQGVGIGRAITAAVAEMYAEQNYHVGIISGHPSMLGILRSDSRWRVKRVAKFGNKRVENSSRLVAGKYAGTSGEFRSSFGRGVVSAEWVGASKQ